MPKTLTSDEIGVLRDLAAPSLLRLKNIEAQAKTVEVISTRLLELQSKRPALSEAYDASLKDILVALGALESANTVADVASEALFNLEEDTKVVIDQCRVAERILEEMK